MKYSALRFPDFKYKAVTLSYDDDTIYDKKLVEIIDKYGLKCTFNLNSGLFGTNARSMTLDEAVALFKGGKHEIAVHGVKHLSLAEFDKAIGLDDVLTDRKNLERIFGGVVDGMAYANGSYDDKVVDMLKNCGIKYSRTTVSTHKFDVPTDWLRLPATCHHIDDALPELTEEFLKDFPPETHYVHKRPKLFYLWGHAYEFNDSNNWNVIEDFCKKVGGREDVWYATNGEVYEYVKAFDNLVFSVSGDTIKNPSALDVYMNYYGTLVKIGAGETVRVEL